MLETKKIIYFGLTGKENFLRPFKVSNFVPCSKLIDLEDFPYLKRYIGS